MPRKSTPDPEKYCERCGKRLRRNRYGKTLEDMTRFKCRKFCSLRCANSRGIRSMSSTQQHKLSARFRKPRCELCGVVPPKSQLHVHHINKNWRDHRPENLQTLCIKCHLQIAHPRKPAIPCKVCGKKSRRHSMCQKHFQRWKKYGNPLMTKVRDCETPNAYKLVCES